MNYFEKLFHCFVWQEYDNYAATGKSPDSNETKNISKRFFMSLYIMKLYY